MLAQFLVAKDMFGGSRSDRDDDDECRMIVALDSLWPVTDTPAASTRWPRFAPRRETVRRPRPMPPTRRGRQTPQQTYGDQGVCERSPARPSACRVVVPYAYTARIEHYSPASRSVRAARPVRTSSACFHRRPLTYLFGLVWDAGPSEPHAAGRRSSSRCGKSRSDRIAGIMSRASPITGIRAVEYEQGSDPRDDRAVAVAVLATISSMPIIAAHRPPRRRTSSALGAMLPRHDSHRRVRRESR